MNQVKQKYSSSRLSTPGGFTFEVILRLEEPAESLDRSDATQAAGLDDRLRTLRQRAMASVMTDEDRHVRFFRGVGELDGLFNGVADGLFH